MGARLAKSGVSAHEYAATQLALMTAGLVAARKLPEPVLSDARMQAKVEFLQKNSAEVSMLLREAILLNRHIDGPAAPAGAKP